MLHEKPSKSGGIQAPDSPYPPQGWPQRWLVPRVLDALTEERLFATARENKTQFADVNHYRSLQRVFKRKEHP